MQTLKNAFKNALALILFVLLWIALLAAWDTPEKQQAAKVYEKMKERQAAQIKQAEREALAREIVKAVRSSP